MENVVQSVQTIPIQLKMERNSISVACIQFAANADMHNEFPTSSQFIAVGFYFFDSRFILVES